jgi:hypothetical protein
MQFSAGRFRGIAEMEMAGVQVAIATLIYQRAASFNLRLFSFALPPAEERKPNPETGAALMEPHRLAIVHYAIFLLLASTFCLRSPIEFTCSSSLSLVANS